MSESKQSQTMKVSNYRHKKILEMLSMRQSVSADELATEFGVSKITIRRDLDALAIDNAVEGSREALGAAAALFQSKHADPRWRPLFGRIAEDEARHAQLAWDIDAWLGARARPELRNYEGMLPQIEGLGAPGPELGRRLAAAIAASESAA